jgi:outer membrane protein OmpA-like peptidoglycan-associated protein
MLINFNISVDRAVAVADELVRQGVASDNIEIDAKGDGASVQVASGEQDAAEQRRVEVYFTN